MAKFRVKMGPPNPEPVISQQHDKGGKFHWMDLESETQKSEKDGQEWVARRCIVRLRVLKPRLNACKGHTHREVLEQVVRWKDDKWGCGQHHTGSIFLLGNEGLRDILKVSEAHFLWLHLLVWSKSTPKCIVLRNKNLDFDRSKGVNKDDCKLGRFSFDKTWLCIICIHYHSMCSIHYTFYKLICIIFMLDAWFLLKE